MSGRFEEDIEKIIKFCGANYYGGLNINLESSGCDWDLISHVRGLSEDFIKTYLCRMPLEYVLKFQTLQEVFIEDIMYDLEKRLTNNHYEINLKRNYFYIIFKYQKLSEKFIRKWRRTADCIVDWRHICVHQKLSEDFINEFLFQLPYDLLVLHQKLSEDFLFRNKYCFDLYNILKYQKLSEDFLRHNRDFRQWAYLILYQNISLDFIKEHIDEIELTSSEILTIEQSDNVDDDVCSFLCNKLSHKNNLINLLT